MEPDDSDELLKAFLAERDTRCPSCEYNLRGLEGAVCPECGARVQLAVVVPERKHEPRPWLRRASHPLVFLGALLAAATLAAGPRGAAVMLAMWVAAMVGLRMRLWMKRYLAAPLLAPGEWVWRWFVVTVMFLIWLAASMAAVGLVHSGV